MSRFWMVVSCLVALPACAQVLRPIDPSRNADLNSKIYNAGNVSLPIVTQKFYRASSVELPQKRNPSRVVETRRLDYANVDLETHVTTVVPLQNFRPKNEAVATSTVPAETKPTRRARIRDREIRPLTPAGQEELKKQLNRLP